MTVYKTGNMWDAYDNVDYFLITTNSTIKNNGAVVMGRGIAKTVRDKWHGIDVTFGRKITETCGSGGFYGVLFDDNVGFFQVKYHWGDQARLDLIKSSTAALWLSASAAPDRKFALNMPGIGNGGLAYSLVKPIVDELPDNVDIWTFT